MIRSQDATIIWNENDDGLIDSIALVDQAERIDALDAGGEEARQRAHIFDMQYDMSFGACCAGWMGQGSGFHHMTPEALFLEFAFRGYASVEVFHQALDVFGQLDTCDWAREMKARPDRWEADVARRLTP